MKAVLKRNDTNWRVGDVIEGAGELHLLAHCGDSKVVLIGLKDGLFWRAPSKVEDLDSIASEEVAQITSNSSDYEFTRVGRFELEAD